MKKFFAVFMAAVFVLGFAVSAFAIQAEIPQDTQAVVGKGTTQITLGGEVRFRGEARQNIRDFNKDKNDGDVYYDMRVRLSIEAKVTPNTMAYIEFESGNADNNDNLVWGDQSSAAGTGAKGIYQVGNTKKGYVTIRQAWLQHQGSGLLGVPAFVKVGHMPIKLGNGLFLDHSYWGDDAILAGISPMKNMNIIGHTIKFREGNCAFGSSATACSQSGNLYLSNDSTAYGVIFSYEFDKLSAISADVTYVDHQNMGQTADPAIGYPSMHFWNIGLRGNTEISNFGILADVEFQTGKLTNMAANTGDASFKGWAAWLGLYYKVKPVKIYLDWAYGSGGNADDKDIKTFVTTQGVDKHYTYVYEYRTAGAGGQQFGGLANTMFLRLGANADLMKGLFADLSIYWLRAVKDTFGTPVLGKAIKTDSKDIGWEIDWYASYMIDKNLKYWVEGGYLFAGDYWKDVYNPVSGKHDNAWAIRQGIQLNF